MVKVIRSTVLPAPVEAAWEVIRDFNGHDQWHPAVATSQMIVLAALRSGRARAEVEEVRRIAEERYRALKPALAALDPRLLRPLPWNAGYFALIEIPEELGLDPDYVRRHLLAHHSTGIISVKPRYLRLATCSVAAEALPELVERVARGVRELAGR